MPEFFVEQALSFGRPEQTEGLLQKEIDCYELLERAGVAFERVGHSPANTIEACEAVEQVIGVDICKNLFLCNRQQTQYYLLMMPGRKGFKTKYVSAQLGIARLSFGGADAMEQLLNQTPGSVSVLGLMYDKDNRVKLLIDQDILTGEYVRCHPNINTATLKIKTADFQQKLLPMLRHTPTIVRLPV